MRFGSKTNPFILPSIFIHKNNNGLNVRNSSRKKNIKPNSPNSIISPSKLKYSNKIPFIHGSMLS